MAHFQFIWFYTEVFVSIMTIVSINKTSALTFVFKYFTANVYIVTDFCLCERFSHFLINRTSIISSDFESMLFPVGQKPVEKYDIK